MNQIEHTVMAEIVCQVLVSTRSRQRVSSVRRKIKEADRGTLDLSGTWITVTELDHILVAIADAGYQISRLRLYGQQLPYIPASIGGVTSILYLDLRHNRLSSLPPEIGQLTSLKELWANDNPLASLPPEIGHLTSLRGLDISHTKLIGLPPEIGPLTSLQVRW